APPDERALVLYAIMRWANQQPDVTELGKRSNQIARAVMAANARLADELTAPGARVEPAAIALALMTVVENRLAVDQKPQRDALASLLMELRDQDGLFTSMPVDPRSPEAAPRMINHPTRSLIMAAMACLYEQTRQPEYAQ